MTYLFRHGDFYGPIDLLLSLIEKKKVPITDISLSELVDEYVQYFEKNKENISLNEVSQFIFITSILILIKSKVLIPHLKLDEEEENDIEELKERLLLKKEYGKMIPILKNIIGKTPFFFPKMRKNFHLQNPKKIDKKELYLLLKEKIKENKEYLEFQKKRLRARFETTHFRLQELVNLLNNELKKHTKLHFSQILSFHKEKFRSEREKKKFTALSFLAALELMKRGKIQLIQKKKFDRIYITSNENSLKYDEQTRTKN